MAKRKVCVVVASRANYARIKSVMAAIREHPALKLQLIVGASALLERFGNVLEIIQKDGFKADATVYVVIEGENPTTMAKSTGLAIIELATQFENLKPDVVLTVADRYETISTAIAASYMNIIVAHSQGGEVTGSIDESVRHAITKLSHLHFAATEMAYERLIRMGEDPKYVFVTGCPSIDLVANIDLSKNSLLSHYGGVGAAIDLSKPYLVVLQHPVTTEYGQGFEQVNETLQAIAELKMQTVWFWPNVDAGSDHISKGLRSFREQYQPDYIHFYRNFTPEDFARLAYNCACLVGNSSFALREGSFLGVPAVTIGTRQKGRERAGNVFDVDFDRDKILEAIHRQMKNGRHPRSYMYGDGTAGKKIADILAGPLPPIQKHLAF